MRYIFLQLFLHAALGLVNTLSTADVFGDEKKDFMWGVATAAYQIEGATNVDGRGPSIWDTFSKLSGKINNGDNGDIADGSYTKFMEDIQLIKNMGLKSYRFSISWSRIMPTGEFPVNQAGIEHYNLVINELIAAGIAPLVTLYHWDLPEALDENYGGWLNPHMEDFFKRYADVCFRSFGDRVKLWLTLNEPWTFINMGYVAGIFAPGRCSDRNRCAEGNSSSEGYIAAHNALNAHAATVELYRTKYQAQQGGLIGIALNHDFGLPWSQSEADIAAAQIRNEFYIGWFADPIFYGKYPDSMIEKVGDRLPTFTKEQSDRIKGSVDFHAFNHYTSKYIYDPMNLGDNAFKLLTDSVPMGIGGWWDDQGVLDTKYSIQGNLIGTQGASTWLHVVPEGFYEVVMWNTRRYTVDGKKPVMFIMENGCDVPHENQMTMKEALNDTFRVDFYRQYLGALQRAIRDGADVRGYMAWSLMDNFEWVDGYNFRFGLHYVDYKDPNLGRHPKNSARWYSAFAKKHPNFGHELDDDTSKEGGVEGGVGGDSGEAGAVTGNIDTDIQIPGLTGQQPGQSGLSRDHGDDDRDAEDGDVRGDVGTKVKVNPGSTPQSDSEYQSRDAEIAMAEVDMEAETAVVGLEGILGLFLKGAFKRLGGAAMYGPFGLAP